LLCSSEWESRLFIYFILFVCLFVCLLACLFSIFASFDKQVCPEKCYEHGSCDDEGKCSCHVNWEGELCDVPVCSPRCASDLFNLISIKANIKQIQICAVVVTMEFVEATLPWVANAKMDGLDWIAHSANVLINAILGLGIVCFLFFCLFVCLFFFVLFEFLQYATCGRGSCDAGTGVCECPSEYTGADCSYTAIGNKHMRGCQTRAHCRFVKLDYASVFCFLFSSFF
jgi:hypothetical protein